MNKHASQQAHLTAVRAFIALGANIGEPLEQLDAAVKALDNVTAITCLAMSKVYQSPPHGPQDQPDFTNAVVAITTTLAPTELLSVMQAIELGLGRTRKRHWGERKIDLDLILHGDTVMQTPALTIPHPRAHQREFVVKPLYDLDPKLYIPSHGYVADLLQNLPVKNLREIRDGTTYHH